MIFVPFIVVDHHKKSVTVGAGLLSNESVESYCWLLRSFLKAHRKQPILVLIDQDPEIKQAIESVFPNSKHRLCMWHIMKKLQSKVSADLYTNKDFRKIFSKLVWDMSIIPEVFEIKWGLLIKEFKLEDTRWFKYMFTIHKASIPGYFCDIPMCGLMKTTSRSESMNSFFNTYSQSGNLLLNFMMNYDTALQKQRNTQQELDKATKKASYTFKTPLELEKHSSKIYTSKIFYEVQKEIFKATFYCTYTNLGMENGWDVYIVEHRNQRSEFKNEFRVKIKYEKREIECSCQHCNRMGVLCRHAFAIMLKFGIKEIPEKYILNRWRNDVISRSYRFSTQDIGAADVENVKLVNEVYYMFESCLDIVRDNKEKLASFVDKQRLLWKEYEKDSACAVVKKDIDSDVVSKLMSVSIPEDMQIQVLEVQRNKGCGTKKRIASAIEKACESSKKQSRMCTGCGLRVPHNLRTFPVRIEAEKSAAEKSAAEKSAREKSGKVV